jgi:hypothetical protein
MSAVPPLPTRPDEVTADATVAELLAAYQRHLALAVMARAAADHDARHALAALAVGQAIVDSFAVERWPLVRDALEGGATADDAGAALGGLEVDEISAGLTSWAQREHRAGGLSLDDYDAVIELLEGGAR